MEDSRIRTLIEEIKNDNETAFREFFEFYYPRFLRIAHYYTRINENAEEVVMDVFSRLWSNRRKLHEVKNFNNYAFTSVKNQALNYLQKNNIDQESLNEYTSSKLIEYVEPERLFLGKELARELEKAVSTLPPRCQLIFRMIREDGLKYREVAEILDISLKAVENQLSIAMKRVRHAMERYIEQPPRKSWSKREHLFLFSLHFQLFLVPGL